MRDLHAPSASLALLALLALCPAPGRPAGGAGPATSPAVAVLVADQGPADARPVPWWAPGRGTAAPTRTGDVAVATALREGGLRLVDVAVAPGARRLASTRLGAAPLPAARVREVARLLGADVLVHGSAVAIDEEDAAGLLEQSSGMKPSSTGRPCSVAVALRAHRADTGEVLASTSGSGRSTAFRASDCASTALAKAVKSATPELRERILAYWRERAGS